MMTVSADISPIVDPATLAAEWQRLEAQVDPVPFLRWAWIGPWLAELADAPLLLRLTERGETVGLGVVHSAVERRKLLRARQIHLNATGDPALDIITIEYNTLLCAPAREAELWPVALRALLNGAPPWDELVVSGATEQTAAILQELGDKTHLRAETTSARVDLTALRERGVGDVEGYLATLGKSTRQQTRRALKLYAERGAVTLEAAQGHAQMLEWFEACGALHEAKWRARGASGAFSSAAYLRFHRRMIADHPGAIEVLRASAGGVPFGYLYNLVDARRALFYLSGFAFEEDNRLKPGLVTQALAVERHVQAGRTLYDFMGGDDRYKANLGEAGPGIVSLAIQRPRLGLTVERAARQLKARLSDLAVTSSKS